MGYKGSNLTPADILEILRQRRELKTPRWKVAEDFGVSKRTITRICNGESWESIVNVSPYKPKPKLSRLNPLPRGYDRDHNEFVNFKRKFGFAFERPVCWGSYDSYDGKRDVVSDGIIMWHSMKGLVREAKRIAEMNDPRKPFLSDRAHELDTFEVSRLMSAPIGEPLDFDLDDLSGIIRYRTVAGRFIFIAEKFVEIAHENGYIFYEVENDPNRVFLVKMVDHIWDPTDGIQATLATVIEDDNETSTQ